MKAFRIAIRKDRKENQTTFIWPDWWWKYYEKAQILAYQDVGQATEFAIGVADAEIVDAMLQEGGEIQQIHPDLADHLILTWRPPREAITDEQRVLSVIAKMTRGEPLTEEDQKALDPNDPTPGVVKKMPPTTRRVAQELGRKIREEGFIPPEAAEIIRQQLVEAGLR